MFFDLNTIRPAAAVFFISSIQKLAERVKFKYI